MAYLQHGSLVHLDVLRRHYGEQSLDDLQLNAFVGLWSHEAVADRRDDAIDEKLAGIRRVGNVSSEVAIGYELLQAVERCHDDPRRLALARQLEGQEIFFSVDAVGRFVLGLGECGRW